MTFRSPKLLKSSNGQICVRCGNTEGVVSAHYTGVRRLHLGGGYGIKVHDFLTADLCGECHSYMDTKSREKEQRYGHSEEFFYYIALTLERRFLQGTLVVAKKGDVGDVVEQPLGLEASVSLPSPRRTATGARDEDAVALRGDEA